MSCSEPKYSRDTSLDMMRGVIMLLMALDHALSMVGKLSWGNEAWGLPLPEHSSLLSFMPRLVSHLCAPGFIFLIGVGIVLLMQCRLKQGWTHSKVRFYLMKRGLILIILQHFLYNPPWFVLLNFNSFPSSAFPGEGGIPWFAFSILSTLGMLIIFWSLLITLKSRYIVILSITALIISQVVILNAKPEMLYHPILRLLFIPGQTGPWLVRVSLVPWLGVTGLGVVWGRSYLANKGKTYNNTLRIALALLVAFILIRLLDNFGNIHSRGRSLLEFFHVTKYPPSLAYLTLTMGVNLLILWGLSKRKSNYGFIQTIGSSPLFFYITHIYVYLLMGMLFPVGTSFWGVLPFWGLGIILLTPLCKKFREFKSRKSVNSFWRML